MHDENAWAAAVVRWAAAGWASAPGGAPVWPDSQDAAVIAAGLVRRARRLGMDDDAAGDAASEALELMARAVGRGTVDPSGNPAAFLTIVARNRGIDAARSLDRSRRRAELAWALSPAADQPVDELIEAVSSVQAVARALKAADPTTRRVASAFMDLAQLHGGRPAAEEVARAAGVSRKTVFVSLRKLRDALDDTDDPTG